MNQNQKLDKNKNVTAIVNGILAGEESAYVDFYDWTYRVAYSVAYNMMKNEEDTLDILQDSYVTAYKKWTRCRSRNQCKCNCWCKRSKLDEVSERVNLLERR